MELKGDLLTGTMKVLAVQDSSENKKRPGVVSWPFFLLIAES